MGQVMISAEARKSPFVKRLEGKRALQQYIRTQHEKGLITTAQHRGIMVKGFTIDYETHPNTYRLVLLPEIKRLAAEYSLGYTEQTRTLSPPSGGADILRVMLQLQ